jgi:hypothetical protein
VRGEYLDVADIFQGVDRDHRFTIHGKQRWGTTVLLSC